MKSRILYHAFCGVLIVAAIFASYWSIVSAEFVWDDRINLKDNPFIRSFSVENLKWMLTEDYMGHYHPMTWLSLAVDYHWYGPDARGYHVTNLILHALGSLLVYALSWQVVQRIAPELNGARAMLFCLASAVIFAIHPTRVESVAWVTERRDVLSFIFIGLFFLAWHKYVKATSAKLTWYLLGVLAFELSLFCKAWGMTIPVVLLALDYTYFNRSSLRFEQLRTQGRLWREKLPFVIIAAVCAWQAFEAQKNAAMDMVRDHTVLDRTVQAGYGLLYYVEKTFIPVSLSPLYLIKDDFNPLSWPYIYYAIVTGLLLIWVIYLFFARLDRWRYFLGGFFFYFITLLPVLGFTQSGQQLAADRYTYIACIPLIFAAVVWVIRRTRTPLTGAFILGVACIGLGFATAKQVKFWQNETTLWSHAIQLDPDNSVAHNNLGLALEDVGDFEGAYTHYDAAVRFFPEYAAALYNRANMRSVRGDAAGAMADYNAALTQDSKMVKAYNNRANLYRDAGEYEASLLDFNRALALNPRYADAYYNRGLTLRALERTDEAIADYTRAIELNPRFTQAYNNRANAYRLLNRNAEAVADYSRAIEINPAYFNAYFNGGNALREMGRNQEALDSYSKALHLNPAHAATWGNRSVCLWRLKQFQEAEAGFRHALELDPKDANTRFNFAQFLRDRGRKDEAAAQFHLVLSATDRSLELHRTAQVILSQLLKSSAGK